MSKGINTFHGVGNLGQDPEYRVAPSGTQIATANCAFNDKRGGTEHTEWLQLKFFKGAADVIRDYGKKGTRLYVRGRIQTDKWEHKEHGYPCQRTCVLVDEFTLLDGNRSDTDGNKAPAAPGGFDDDIPF